MTLLRRVLLSIIICWPCSAVTAPAAGTSDGPAQPPSDYRVVLFREMGQRCDIESGYYFIYRLAPKPRPGAVSILSLHVLDPKNGPTTQFSMTGLCEIPTAPTTPPAKERAFELSGKGIYTLPIKITAHGIWRVTLTFYKGKKDVQRGTFEFKA